nr:hypothetical protein [Tanacetum cinerariifolium]
MMTDKDSSAAGTDNRPPMLEENDYESWRIHIKRYIKGKPHGKLIWKLIQNGPTPHPQTTDPVPEGGAVPPLRNKRDEEFTEKDNRNKLTDIQAINILSQGLPRHIFNILNQNETGREIWVNLELLMKGSGQTLERRKEALFDEFKCYRANGNELIQDYFVRFHKLVNDMKVTQLDIPTHQLNTKFANNLPSYWGKCITHAKYNMSTITYIELFTHLRTYKEHALESLKRKEQSSDVVDPLAYLVKTTPTHSTTSPVTVPIPQSFGDSHNDAMLATMNQIANLLSGVNNSGKKEICYNCCGEGHVARQCKEPKRARDSQWYHDKVLLMQAKEKGVLLDAEAEAFLADVECTAPYDQPLALTTTNLFEANHEDAYDSDVDEGHHASTAFMANLSSTGSINGSSSSYINEVQISDDSFFSDVSYPLAQKMQQEEHLNSEVDLVLDDNMITYDEYQNDSEVETVPTVVSADEVDKQSMIAVLQRMHTEIAGYVRVNDEHKLVNATLTAELERWHALPINYAKLNAMYDQFVPQKELSQEQVYWLPAAKIASQSNTPAKHVAPFVHTRPVKSDVHKKAIETELTQLKDTVTSLKIQNDGKLRAKSAKGEKVEEHIRNLNKNNHVDSHVKRSISVKNLNAVCVAYHECLISSNHDNCLVYSVKSVNRKQPKAKNTARTTKKVWRPKGWKAGSKGIPAMFE